MYETGACENPRRKTYLQRVKVVTACVIVASSEGELQHQTSLWWIKPWMASRSHHLSPLVFKLEHQSLLSHTCYTITLAQTVTDIEIQTDELSSKRDFSYRTSRRYLWFLSGQHLHTVFAQSCRRGSILKRWRACARVQVASGCMGVRVGGWVGGVKEGGWDLRSVSERMSRRTRKREWRRSSPAVVFAAGAARPTRASITGLARGNSASPKFLIVSCHNNSSPSCSSSEHAQCAA